MFIFTLRYLRHYFKEERRKCASKTHIFLSSGKGHKRDHILPINGVPHTCQIAIHTRIRDITKLGNVLDKEFDDRLLIHFCKDKTKYTFFSEEKNQPELTIT